MFNFKNLSHFAVALVNPCSASYGKIQAAEQHTFLFGMDNLNNVKLFLRIGLDERKIVIFKYSLKEQIITRRIIVITFLWIRRTHHVMRRDITWLGCSTDGFGPFTGLIISILDCSWQCRPVYGITWFTPITWWSAKFSTMTPRSYHFIIC